MWPGLTSFVVKKYLPLSATTTKEHMKVIQKNAQSTQNTAQQDLHTIN